MISEYDLPSEEVLRTLHRASADELEEYRRSAARILAENSAALHTALVEVVRARLLKTGIEALQAGELYSWNELFSREMFDLEFNYALSSRRREGEEAEAAEAAAEADGPSALGRAEAAAAAAEEGEVEIRELAAEIERFPRGAAAA